MNWCAQRNLWIIRGNSCFYIVVPPPCSLFSTFFQRFSAFSTFFNIFLKRSGFLFSVVFGNAPMGRLYFVATYSNNKNNKGQHRTTIFLLHCPLLSLVVLCCLIFIIYANYHELAMNFGAHQFMVNYMVIQVPHVNNWPFFHPTCGT